ncbi:hypothetical protein [Planomonospora sphaerica]|nr:hypothetical protein [Planomonospora sphaerica]
MTSHQEQVRARMRSAPLQAPPAPWRSLTPIAVGGLSCVGFGTLPGSPDDLLLVVSSNGRGLFDCATGTRIARDPDPDAGWPDTHELAHEGIGPLSGVFVPVAGLWGGGLHTTTPDGWTLDVVAPDWPVESVMLSAAGGSPYRGEPGSSWWHVHREDACELRAVGFSPSGKALVIASSCTVTLFTRPFGMAREG